jgi:hypothetical protein
VCNAAALSLRFLQLQGIYTLLLLDDPRLLLSTATNLHTGQVLFVPNHWSIQAVWNWQETKRKERGSIKERESRE